MLGEHLDQYTFEYLLKDCLDRIPDTIDKREGSIIYDAVAPACALLTQAYIELKGILIETYALTASGVYLDYRAAEQGLRRYQAEYAIRKAYFLNSEGLAKEVPIGSVFSTIDGSPNLKYRVSNVCKDASGIAVPGYFQLTCEEAGSVGNHYVGNLLPVSFLNDLSVAYMEMEPVYTAKDEETDEELRQRFKEKVNMEAFGGNLAQYRKQILDLKLDRGNRSIGAVQIYPVWNGGGTVKCSIIDSAYMAIKDSDRELLEEVQEKLDPVTENQSARVDDTTPRQGSGMGLGLVPIGHKVTVVTAVEVPLDISAEVSVSPGYSADQVRASAEKAVEDYLLSVRKSWGMPDERNRYYQRIFLSQLNYVIFSVSGVENVTGIAINRKAADLSLTEDHNIQELPVPGEVKINVG